MSYVGSACVCGAVSRSAVFSVCELLTMQKPTMFVGNQSIRQKFTAPRTGVHSRCSHANASRG